MKIQHHTILQFRNVGTAPIIISKNVSGPFMAIMFAIQLAWISSGPIGTYNLFGSCDDMTSTDGQAFAAELHNTSWEASVITPCNSSTNRLICVDKFSGSALDIPEPTGNIAFLTDVAGSGDLDSWADADPGTSGIEAADSTCNNIAAANDLPWQGSYKAWLSDSAVEARDRFYGVGPWHRLDGIKVAENAAGLASGSLLAPINYTDQGRYIKNQGVWTGTNSNGTRNELHCSNWAVESGTGHSGSAFMASAGWTTIYDSNCAANDVRLYCLSDSDLSLFKDGFEAE